MAENKRAQQQGNDMRYGQGVDQFGDNESNAFGQKENDRYQANDQRPHQTGNVSWRPGQQQQQQGHRGKGPKGYSRSDERIREEVYQKLTDDEHIDASEIEVEVRNAEVTLMGTVHDRNEKRHAEDLIENISGVNHVQNNLRVQQGSSPSGSGSRQDMDRRSGGTTALGNAEVM